MGYCWRDGAGANGTTPASFPEVVIILKDEVPSLWPTIDFELILLISLTNVHYCVKNFISDIFISLV